MRTLAHPCSLIAVFADHMDLLRPMGYLKRIEREPLPYWVDVQADLSLCWSHRSYSRFYHALAHFLCFVLPQDPYIRIFLYHANTTHFPLNIV